MQVHDLEVFRDVPFLFWVRDQQGRYAWSNQAINHCAGQDIVGKTDQELPWADRADSFRASDQQVFDTGEPYRLYDHADSIHHGQKQCVCKWLDNFEGQQLCFGISFPVEQEAFTEAKEKEGLKEQSLHYAGP